MTTKKLNHTLSVMVIAIVITFISCSKELNKNEPPAAVQSEASLQNLISENGNNPDDAMIADKSPGAQKGYVYTESNDAAQNKILIYNQDADGSLSWNSAVASGGAGLGTGLGSQGAVVIDKSHKWLYAVNAGDNSVSSFWVHTDGTLTLADTKSSGGTTPVSLSVYKNLLYVVNAGSSNICGFMVNEAGMLTMINGSSQGLSSTGAGPAQISFHPDGGVLFVTEKGTNTISSFKVNGQGVAGSGTFTPSVGNTPFGFDFAHNNHNFLVVSDAAGGAENAGACTSYSSDNWGNVSAVNGAVPNFSSAPCWVAITKYGRFAFVTNTGSNSISTYYISPSGALHLAFFAKTPAESAPTDIIVSSNNRFVYAINSMSHTVTEYQRGILGTLNHIETMPDLPDFAAGLAAF